MTPASKSLTQDKSDGYATEPSEGVYNKLCFMESGRVNLAAVQMRFLIHHCVPRAGLF